VAGGVEARPTPGADGGALPVPGVAAILAKGPYLQGLGATGVTVKVELAVPGPASVEVFATGARDGGDPQAPGGPAVARAEDTVARALHALRVEGLRSATTYEYQVSTAAGVAGERGRFTTAPNDGRPFRFLAYGDSRSDAKAHAAVVSAMEAVPSDFLVNTGDMVSMGNEPRDWAELFAIEGRMLRDRCVFAAVGNHELARGDPAGEVAFLHYFASVEQGHDLDKLYGSFRWSNTRFFMLNAMDGWTGAERDWLRAELDRALDEPGLVHRIAVMHWGPYSSGPHGDNPALAKGDIVTMMRDRKVDLILAGHDHAYERGVGLGLKYVITGGAGAPLYERKTQGAEARRFESAYHFVEVAVDGERVTITARRPSGAVLEACGFKGQGPWDCDPETPPAPSREAQSPTRATSACGCSLPGLAGGTGGWGATAVLALAVLGSRRWKRRTTASSSISTPARGLPSASARRAPPFTATATGTAASTSGSGACSTARPT
jgi:hypothetical protein